MAIFTLDSSLEATRRHIEAQFPKGATLPLTFEAAVLAHAWDKRHPGGGVISAASRMMSNHRGDYLSIREHYDNFAATGILWAGNVVDDG